MFDGGTTWCYRYRTHITITDTHTHTQRLNNLTHWHFHPPDTPSSLALSVSVTTHTNTHTHTPRSPIVRLNNILSTVYISLPSQPASGNLQSITTESAFPDYLSSFSVVIIYVHCTKLSLIYQEGGGVIIVIFMSISVCVCARAKMEEERTIIISHHNTKQHPWSIQDEPSRCRLLFRLAEKRDVLAVYHTPHTKTLPHIIHLHQHTHTHTHTKEACSLCSVTSLVMMSYWDRRVFTQMRHEGSVGRNTERGGRLWFVWEVTYMVGRDY